MRHLLAVGVLLLAGACTEPLPPVPADELRASERASVVPADFAVVPCDQDVRAPCVLLLAGGKRLLFGAPAGISHSLPAEDLAELDGVFLFSLLPQHVEGLDEVRNSGWRAGRPDALQVSGPNGTESLVEGLNLAFEQPDALSFVEEGAPSGGFDAALLSNYAEVRPRSALVFDRGDLKVDAATGQGTHATYTIRYRDLSEAWHELVLRPCGGPAPENDASRQEPETRVTIACETENEDVSWPVQNLFFITRSEG